MLQAPYPANVDGDPLCPKCLVPLDFHVGREIESEVAMLFARCRICDKLTPAVPLPSDLNMEKITAVLREGAPQDG